MNRSRPSAATLVYTLITWTFLGVIHGQSAGSDSVPVTVAIDTSRSLRSGDLAQTKDQLSEALALLPSDQPTGLLAFDDAPRWIVPVGATPSDVIAALADLTPDGNFTQLHDALVVAARAMEGGGVIMLATDGRDENSATTLEDVARVCEAQAVRILPVAMGPRLEERSLRRLALLTGGDYLGRVQPSEVVDAVTLARTEIDETRRARTVPQTGTTSPRPTSPDSRTAEPSTTPESTSETSEDAETTGRPFIVPLILALLTILVLAAVLARMMGTLRRGDETTEAMAHYCPRCGGAVADEGAPCPRCSEEDLVERLRDRGIMELRDTAEFPVQKPTSVEESFDPSVLEVTRVLADENMITVRGNGVEPRSYLLSAESAFAIGRDVRGNTIGLKDKALSARHFKIVPEDGRYFVIDLGSTNGTYVNDQPVRSHQLKSGDVIRAGRSEFEYRSKARALS